MIYNDRYGCNFKKNKGDRLMGIVSTLAFVGKGVFRSGNCDFDEPITDKK
jgi:hypothetical protein